MNCEESPNANECYLKLKIATITWCTKCCLQDSTNCAGYKACRHLGVPHEYAANLVYIKTSDFHC